MVIVVMGVSGCGKSAVGTAVGERLGLPFFDADDFHPERNRAKMAGGTPLDETDRAPWLADLATHIRRWNAAGGAVLACSALRKAHRDVLRGGTDPNRVVFVFLDGSRETLHRRMTRREHFMPASLLDTQLETLERPGESADDPCVTVSFEPGLEDVVGAAIEKLRGDGLGRVASQRG